MPSDEPLLLWGPMGAGKSVVGARVAATLERPFVDLDRAIEVALGATIADVFRERGEPAFRAAEREALRAALDRGDAPVVALGGGALVDASSRAEALARARVITLGARPEVLASRLAGEVGRPLLGADDTARIARLRALLDARQSAYAIGAVRIDVSDLSIDAVVARVLAAARDDVVRIADDAWVHFTDDAFASLRDAASGASRVLVVTDTNVHALYGAQVARALEGLGAGPPVVIAPGERAKRLASVEHLAAQLAEIGADRRSLVVAVGGGVVTDLAGFAASVFMRGIPWIAVPTTTLGMVDAAIGGKTAVDLDVRKNLIGAFHMPLATIVDPSLARTESTRARASGFAEVIKSLAIGDRAGFEALERADPSLDEAAWRAAVRRGAAVKVRVVRDDPTEKGLRAILNFGHTFGHALEAFGGLERWTHGEAVALGMVAAARVGVAIGVTARDSAERLRAAIARFGLPHAPARDDLVGAAAFLGADKKRERDAVRFVLLEELGRCRVERLALGELERLIPQICG